MHVTVVDYEKRSSVPQHCGMQLGFRLPEEVVNILASTESVSKKPNNNNVWCRESLPNAIRHVSPSPSINKRDHFSWQFITRFDFSSCSDKFCLPESPLVNVSLPITSRSPGAPQSQQTSFPVMCLTSPRMALVSS